MRIYDSWKQQNNFTHLVDTHLNLRPFKQISRPIITTNFQWEYLQRLNCAKIDMNFFLHPVYLSGAN
jgi:hypothetical protein